MLYNQLNKFVNILKKDQEETHDKYPWLEKEIKGEICEITYVREIDLEKSCLSEQERKM